MSRAVLLRVRLLAPAFACLRFRSKRAIILPPTTPGSLGDEAMVQALTTQLIAKGLSVDLLAISEAEDWSNITGLNSVKYLSRFSQNLNYVRLFSQYREFYLLGADVLDGQYHEESSIWLLWLSWVARYTCSVSTIAGFSISENPLPSCINMFKRLPRKININLRDSASLDRYMEHTGKSAALVADIAFLLKPSANTNQITDTWLQWIDQQHHNKHKIIGLNISSHSFSGDSVPAQKIVDTYSRELAVLLSADHSLSCVLIPHDMRGQQSDEVLLRAVYRKLSKQYGTRLLLLDSSIDARTVKLIVSKIDATLSGRMHLAIACLGVKTPVACVTYQGKFEGLYKNFPGLEKFAISPNRALTPGTLSAELTTILAEATQLKQAIKHDLPRVIRLAQDNIA